MFNRLLSLYLLIVCFVWILKQNISFWINFLSSTQPLVSLNLYENEFGFEQFCKEALRALRLFAIYDSSAISINESVCVLEKLFVQL